MGNGTVKNESELSGRDLQYLLESAQNGEMSDNSYIPLRRNTPEFFIGVVKEHSKGTVVAENYPMAVTVEHIRQNMDEADGQSYGDARPHGFSVDDIITISEKMGDPSYIVLQENGRYAEVVSFYNKRNKQVVVAIDFADSNPAEPKNYKYSQYMNGYRDGYYNIIVTQYEPDNFAKYLNDNEVVYSKKEMNGRYQVGSGRIVTVTHDTPFIEDIVTDQQPGVNPEIEMTPDGYPVAKNTEGEVTFSLSNDSLYMDKAIAANDTSMMVDTSIMDAAKTVRAKVAERMSEIKDKGMVGLPEDIAPPVRKSGDVYGSDIALGDIPIRQDLQQNASVENGGSRRLTNSDLADYMKVGDRKHVRDAKQRIVEGGDSPILTRPSEIFTFIRNALQGKVKNVVKAYGRVNERLAKRVKNATNAEVNIDDYYLELVAKKLLTWEIT